MDVEILARIQMMVRRAENDFIPGALEHIASKADPIVTHVQPCTQELAESVRRAYLEALFSRTRHITANHLVLGILAGRNSIAVRGLQELAFPSREVSERIQLETSGSVSEKATSIAQIQLASEVDASVDRGREIAGRSGKLAINTGHLLLGILTGPQCGQAWRSLFDDHIVAIESIVLADIFVER